MDKGQLPVRANRKYSNRPSGENSIEALPYARMDAASSGSLIQFTNSCARLIYGSLLHSSDLTDAPGAPASQPFVTTKLRPPQEPTA